MEDTTYNGWTNHATWVANLWITNDQALIERVTEQIRALALSNSYLHHAADIIKEELESDAEFQHPTLFNGGSFVLDMFNGYMADVNWREVVESIVSDMPDLFITEEGALDIREGVEA